MLYLNELKEIIFWNNSLYQFILAVSLFICLLISLKIIQVIVLKRLRTIARKTENDFDDVLIKIFSKIRPPFYLIVSFYFAIQFLSLPDLGNKIVKVFFIVVLVYEAIQALSRLSDYFVEKYLLRNVDEEELDHSRSMVRATGIIVKVILWLLGITLILSNLGINVTSIIASLGIGGIAVALALQNILSDMFSSFSIYIDKPFKVGDFISTGENMGTVEKIGLKTTRIRTLQGEELVISNQELTSARVQNFKRMEQRRVAFDLGVVYETAFDKLKNIPLIIKEVVESAKNTDFDRSHFKEYGEFALIYENVFFVNSADYNEYMDIRQDINFKIFQRFSVEGIQFAYPTQKLLLSK